jgi:hypothetical protein
MTFAETKKRAADAMRKSLLSTVALGKGFGVPPSCGWRRFFQQFPHSFGMMLSSTSQEPDYDCIRKKIITVVISGTISRRDT